MKKVKLLALVVLFIAGPSFAEECKVAPGFDAGEKFPLFDMAMCYLETPKGIVLKVKRKDNKLRFLSYHEVEGKSHRCSLSEDVKGDTGLDIIVGEVIQKFHPSFGAKERFLYIFDCQLKNPRQPVNFSQLFTPGGVKVVVIDPVTKYDQWGNKYNWRWPEDDERLLNILGKK